MELGIARKLRKVYVLNLKHYNSDLEQFVPGKPTAIKLVREREFIGDKLLSGGLVVVNLRAPII